MKAVLQFFEKHSVYLVSAIALIFRRGREAFLSKLEANARLKNAEADLKSVEVKGKQFELHKQQFDYLLELGDKLDIVDSKADLKKRLLEVTNNFVLGDKK
jgi:hypothetical protein